MFRGISKGPLYFEITSYSAYSAFKFVSKIQVNFRMIDFGRFFSSSNNF